MEKLQVSVEDVEEIVREVLRIQRSIAADEDLLRLGLDMDSLSIVQISIKLEKAYAVRFRAEELDFGLFSTVGKIAELIRAKQKVQEEGAL